MATVDPPKYTWSYSSLKLFQLCPRKYYHMRIKKDVVEPPTEQMLYGNDVHKAAENFVRDDAAVPEKYGFMKEALALLKARRGRHLCEYKIGLRRDLSPCAFFAKDVWMRGIADLVTVQEDRERAFIIDYKTGNPRWADVKQLELMALAVFKHMPGIKHIKAGLLFLLAEDLVPAKFEQEHENTYWAHWLEDTARLEQAMETNVWNARPNFTCKKHCPITQCEHNRRG